MIDEISSNIDFSQPVHKILLVPLSVNPGIIKRNIVLTTGRLSNFSVFRNKDFLIEQAYPLFTGKTYLTGNEQFWIVFGILHNIQNKLRYFKESINFDGLTTLAIKTIEELSLNGISDQSIKELLVKDSENDKWKELLLIKSEYIKYKEDNKYFDYSDCVMALLHSNIKLDNVFYLDFDKTFLENKLLAQLDVKLIKKKKKQGSFKLDGYKVDTPSQEVFQTIRNIMLDIAEAKTPVKIGICLPEYSYYYSLFKSALKQIDTPDLIHFLSGTPMFTTRTGRLWKYLSEWILNDYSIFRFLKILDSGCFNIEDNIKEADSITENDMNKNKYSIFSSVKYHFRKSGIQLFNKSFVPSMEMYFTERKPEEDVEKVKIESNVKTNTLYIAKIFEPLVLGITKEEQLNALYNLLESISRQSGKEDIIVYNKIQNTILGLADSSLINNPEITFEDLIITISELLKESNTGGSLPDFTKPVAGVINDLTYFDFDKIYILGLNEKGLPHKVSQNALLLDFEKEILKAQNGNATFYLVEDILKNKDDIFYSLINNVKNEVVLSAPLRDFDSGREFLCSRYFLDIWNFYKKDKVNHKYNYKSISRDLALNKLSQNNFIPENPANAFYNFESALSIILNNAKSELSNSSLGKHFPFSKAIISFYENKNTMKEFNEYWGNLSLNPKREFPVISPTRLSNWVHCPQKYFLKYELQLDKSADYDSLDLTWLGDLQYGNFLHSVYFEFLNKLRESKGNNFNNVSSKDKTILIKIFEDTIKEYSKIYPIKSVIHFNYQYEKLKNDIDKFFDLEVTNDSQRLFIELSFGITDRGYGDTFDYLDSPINIKLPDGESLLVRGAIDRIDKTKDGVIEIIDYKSGSGHTYNAKAPFDGGKQIQAGLYPLMFNLLAQKSKINTTGMQFKYIYATAEQNFAEMKYNVAEVQEHFLRLLNAIIVQIKSGNFVPVLTSKDYGTCFYCDYVAICHSGKKLLGDSIKKYDSSYQTYSNIVKENLENENR